MTSGILPPFRQRCQWGIGKKVGAPLFGPGRGLGRAMLWDCLPPALRKKREGVGRTPVAGRRKNQNLKGGATRPTQAPKSFSSIFNSGMFIKACCHFSTYFWPNGYILLHDTLEAFS